MSRYFCGLVNVIGFFVRWVSVSGLLVILGGAEARSESDLAARMLDRVAVAEWGTTDLSWRQTHPEATCNEGQRAASWKLQSEDACFVCSARDGELNLEYRFYLADDPEDGGRCQLRGLYLRRDVELPLSDARVVLREIERALETSNPGAVTSTELDLEEEFSRLWEDGRAWADPSRTRYWYLQRASMFGERKERAFVTLRVVDSELLRPIEWNSPHGYWPADDWDWPVRVRDRIASEIGEALERADRQRMARVRISAHAESGMERVR